LENEKFSNCNGKEGLIILLMIVGIAIFLLHEQMGILLNVPINSIQPYTASAHHNPVANVVWYTA